LLPQTPAIIRYPVEQLAEVEFDADAVTTVKLVNPVGGQSVLQFVPIQRPEPFIVPATSNFAVGLAVPIPTLPTESTVTAPEPPGGFWLGFVQPKTKSAASKPTKISVMIFAKISGFFIPECTILWMIALPSHCHNKGGLPNKPPHNVL
jgi:hypothetical protein